MTPRELWERYKALLFDDPDLGLRLDLSRAGLGEAALAEREASMQAAFAAMEALESGAIANPDENRMVGHYWLRAPERAPAPEIAAAIRDTRARVLDFASRVHDGRVKPPRAERFRHLLVVGIGGSALGPQLVADALGGPGDRLSPHFLDNTDPDGIDRVLSRLGDALDETLAVVISKSGGTAETRNGLVEAAAAYRARCARLRRPRGGHHAGGEHARPAGARAGLPGALPDVGLGGRPHLGDERGGPPPGGAPGDRRRGAPRGGGGDGRGHATPRDPAEPGRAPRARLARGRARAGARRPWWSCPTRTASSCSAATCSSW